MLDIAEHRAAFQTRGLTIAHDLVPQRLADLARAVVLNEMERRGLWQDGAWRLDRLPPTEQINAGANLVKEIKRSREFADVMTPQLVDVVTALVGGRRTTPAMGIPQLLFTLPNATAWTVPHGVWHLDVPRLPDVGVPGVQVFTFLDTVAPGGGGTLVVAGSHRLLNARERIASCDVKRRLKREPYFKALMSRDIEDRSHFVQQPGRVGDVEVQVVELSGEPGDVYFMDMRLLHTLAPNTAAIPRMMLTQRFLLEEAHALAYGN